MPQLLAELPPPTPVIQLSYFNISYSPSHQLPEETSPCFHMLCLPCSHVPGAAPDEAAQRLWQEHPMLTAWQAAATAYWEQQHGEDSITKLMCFVI
jgi:hypothetical protein